MILYILVSGIENVFLQMKTYFQSIMEELTF